MSFNEEPAYDRNFFEDEDRIYRQIGKFMAAYSGHKSFQQRFSTIAQMPKALAEAGGFKMSSMTTEKRTMPQNDTTDQDTRPKKRAKRNAVTTEPATTEPVALSSGADWTSIAMRAVAAGGDVRVLKIIAQILSPDNIDRIKKSLDQNHLLLVMNHIGENRDQEGSTSPSRTGTWILEMLRKANPQPLEPGYPNDNVWKTYHDYISVAELAGLMDTQVEKIADPKSDLSLFYKEVEDELPVTDITANGTLLALRKEMVLNLGVYVNSKRRGNQKTWGQLKNDLLSKVSIGKIAMYLRDEFSPGFLLALPFKQEEELCKIGKTKIEATIPILIEMYPEFMRMCRRLDKHVCRYLDRNEDVEIPKLVLQDTDVRKKGKNLLNAFLPV